MILLKQKFYSLQKAKKIYFFIYFSGSLLLSVFVGASFVEMEKQNFYAKARADLTEISRSFLETDKKLEMDDFSKINLERKKEILKNARNLENKLFNLKTLYFHQKGDFSLNLLNFGDQKYLNKMQKSARVFLGGQRYVRNAEILISQEEPTENQLEIYKKNKNLFRQALNDF